MMSLYMWRVAHPASVGTVVGPLSPVILLSQVAYFGTSTVEDPDQ
jgi:hypothetical protein